MANTENLWTYLPYPVLYKIFNYLDLQDLISVSQVCRSWYQVSRDDFIWRDLFFRIFKIDKTVPVITGKTWYEEFKRLCYNVPLIETETLKEHGHQVLHVSFSHNGKYFATCSKDGYVLLVKYLKTLVDGFELRCRVVNKPYDIYGTWYNDQHLLSGDLHWLAHLVSTSSLSLNKASQETSSEHVPITHNMFRFYNRNASSIRAIMIANCLPNSENIAGGEGGASDVDGSDQNGDKNDSLEHGNPVSHREIRAIPCRHSQVNYATASSSRSRENTLQPPSPIWYNSEYRKVETEINSTAGSDSEDEDDNREYIDEDISDDEYYIDINNEVDKYLIFTTGFKTYTPHQIGFKRIKPFAFPTKLDPGPSLKERLIIHERRKELLRSGSPPPEPNWLDYDSVADKFDKIDHLIDLHGHIVGMALSPDHRYLYVNSRSWPEGYKISNPLDPPPIAQEIDIHVIDLVTLKQVGKMFRAHRAYTSNSECFFIFLDVCNEYVASGAEDKFGYIWDRHYGMGLVKFPHMDVVNSVAFNPKDPEMLVTTSDDNTIKVWRSLHKVRQLGLDETRYPRGAEFRKNVGKVKRWF